MKLLKFTAIMSIIMVLCGIIAYWPPLAAIILVALGFVAVSFAVWEILS